MAESGALSNPRPAVRHRRVESCQGRIGFHPKYPAAARRDYVTGSLQFRPGVWMDIQ
jgi:hypothetical protein